MKEQRRDPVPAVPSSLEAERALLGSILLENSALDLALESVEKDDFFSQAHRITFGKMLAIAEKGRTIDLVTLCEELSKEDGQIEKAGGAAYLAALTDGVPLGTSVAVSEYARIIREKADLRRLAHIGEALRTAALAENEDALPRALEMLSTLDATKQKQNGLAIFTAPELVAATRPAVECIAYPVAVRRMIALLDGRAKAAGKTTFLLCAARAALHEEMFLNRPARGGPILFVSEEDRETLTPALRRMGLDADARFHIVPRSSWAGHSWLELTRQIERKCVELGIAWLIVDTFFGIAGLEGEAENQAGAVHQAVAPILAMTGRLDIATTLTRHERKSGGAVGMSGRGSSMLTGDVDVVALLKCLPANHCATMRSLDLTGRMEAASLTIELRGERYISHGEHADSRISTAEDAKALAEAIAINPQASLREFGKQTGIDRRRLARVAQANGWVYRDSGWEQGG
jgi:hypothetical protein